MKKSIIFILAVLTLLCILISCNSSVSTEEFDSVKKTVEQLQNENASLKASMEDFDSVKKNVEQLQNENASLKAGMEDFDSVKKTVEQLQEENTSLKTSLELLQNNVISNEFVVGDTLSCPVGTTFKLPINDQKDEYASIKSLTVTKKKEADINNIDDYWGIGSSHYYNRYIYEAKITGTVDKKFANREIYIGLDFDTYNGYIHTGAVESSSIVGSDGSFQIECLLYSNRNENVIIPHYAYIQNYDYLY